MEIDCSLRKIKQGLPNFKVQKRVEKQRKEEELEVIRKDMECDEDSVSLSPLKVCLAGFK